MVLAEALDMVGDSVVTIDGRGRVASWNLAATTLYGLRYDEVLDRPIEELLGPYPEEVAAQLRAQGSWAGRLERTRPDGGTFVVRARIARRPDDVAGAETVIEVTSAIDAKHPAEKKLEEIEYRYRNLFGAVAASFWELDFRDVGRMLAELRAEGVTDLKDYFARHPKFVRQMMRATRIVDFNDISVTLFEGSRQQLLEASIDQFWPDDSSKDFAASVIAAISGETHFVVETRQRTLMGREFDVLFTVTFLPGTVGVGTLLIGVTDITERVKASSDLREANLRNRMFLEVSSVALSEMVSPELTKAFDDLRAKSVTDLNAFIEANPGFVDCAMANIRFNEVNDAAVKLFGAKSRKDLVGRTLTQVFVPSRDVFRAALESVYHSNASFQAEMQVISLDGRQADTIFCIVAPPELRRRGIVLAAHFDITELVKARRDLDRLRQDVAHSARISILGELSASIAHEISQPITAITTNASALGRALQGDSPKLDLANSIAQRLQLDTVRIRDIVQRIRTLAINKEVMFAPVSLTGVVGDSLALLAHELRENSIKLEMSKDDPTLLVNGDRVQLQQVMVNLIINAIQAMEKVKPTERAICIALSRSDAAINVAVMDRGTGFSVQAPEDMFESFTSTKQGGLGMGLAICRSIVEAHGGTLTASNRSDGPGAVLTIQLPKLGQAAIR